MKHRLFLFAAILSCLCPGAFASSICNDRSPAAVAETLGIDLNKKPQRRTDKPNVIIISVDDMGYADAGAYGGEIPTPNIDRIASGGAKFTAGYAASSLCSPSRAGFITGKQPNTFGYARNIVGEEYHLPRGLPLSEKTIADHFREAGYVTGIIGKWHLGESEKYLPRNRGFDEYVRWNHGSSGYYAETQWRYIRHNLNQSLVSRMESCSDDEKYLTDIQSLEAASYVLRHRNEPFLMYVSFDAPHSPFQPRKEGLKARLSYYLNPAYRRILLENNWRTRAYFKMVVQLDEAIGHILDTVDSLGLSENTLIWFFSDNGGGGYSNNGILRSTKGYLYEGGIRVPFMVHWPGTIPPTTYNWPVTTLDILPTSLAAIGAYPENTPPALSGRNVLPYLVQKITPPVHDFYWRTQGKRKHKNKSTEVIRRGEWKLIVNSDLGTPWKSELYNLKQDISEQHNLTEKEPEVFQSLAQKLTAWTTALPKALW